MNRRDFLPRFRGLALASPKVSAVLDGRGITKVVYVPGRLVNIVG